MSVIIVRRKCINEDANMIDMYFLLLLSQVDFLGAILFYFLESTNFGTTTF